MNIIDSLTTEEQSVITRNGGTLSFLEKALTTAEKDEDYKLCAKIKALQFHFTSLEQSK